MALPQERAEPVRIYADDDSRLPRRLSAILQDKIDRYSVTVIEGQLSFERYKQLTGQITGLKEALRECEEMSKTLE